jgi:hypothetical protein
MSHGLNAAAASQRIAMTEPHSVETNGLTWMAIHGTLCLGLRHPAYKGPSRLLVKSFTEELGRKLVEWGALTEEELALVDRTEQQESLHGNQ